MLGPYKVPKFTPPKDINLDYSEFRGGLNTLFRQTELRDNELAQADNMYLIGSGVPTKRWGSQNYFLSAPTGYGRGLVGVKSDAGTIELLALTDWGVLTKRSGASYTTITGASWASGYNLEGTQLNNNIYLVNGQRELVRYNFTNLTSFTTIATPTGLYATNLSGATGTTTYSWRIAATTQVGETLGSTALSFASLPQKLSDTLIRVQWTPVSAASGVLTGYNIYRGALGDEVWVGGVNSDTTRFDDFGDLSSLLRQPPTTDTTGGPIAKYIIRFQDRLILSGIINEPTKVLISGRVPQHERFDWYGGGGLVYVDPSTGENVTGLGVHQGRIIVFKENSVWQVSFKLSNAGNYAVLEPSYQLITASQGCSSHRSITPVDNDLLFLNSKGVYVLGYEPNITGDTLRTNELSAKIRPFFESLSQADANNATAVYFDYKYIVAFPNSKKCVIFDKERLAWMGPWSTTFGINKFIKHTDSDGIERLLCIDADDNYVSEFSSTLVDDKGVAFGTVLRTKKDDMGDWSIFKTINESLLSFRNIAGTANVNIYIEDRDGNVTTAKTFSVTGPTSQITATWGSDMWGSTRWGISNIDAASFAEETIKKALLYKTARYIQYEVTTAGRNDDYELLGIKTRAIPQGVGSTPAAWNVD